MNLNRAWPLYSLNYIDIASPTLTGGNSYENMRAVATRLGLKTSADTGYNEKIGISLRPRTPVVLGGAQLIAAQDNNSAHSLTELATQAQAGLGFNTSEVDMWFAENTVDVPVAAPTIYLAQKASPQSAPSSSTEKASIVQRLGVCQYLTQESTQIAPDLDALMYMSHYKDQIVDFISNPDGTERTDTVVRVLQKPLHGALVATGYDRFNRFRYEYFVNPNPNQDGDDKFYTGVDTFALEISAGGETVQIHYRFGIEVGQSQTYYAEGGERVNNTAVDTYCPDGEMWKISQTTPDASTGDLAAWQRNAAWKRGQARIKNKLACDHAPPPPHSP